MTDRHRLSGGLSDSDVHARLRAQIADGIAAALDMIQIRERDLDGAALAAIVREAVARSRGTQTRIVVNERLDVALACGADGVHLRSDSLPPAAARALAPSGFLIGRSIHTLEEAQAAAPDCDYMIAGTAFATESKPGQQHFLGVEGLAAIAHAVPVPVLAIGGITLDRVSDVVAAGVAGLAAIGLFSGAGWDQDRVAAWRSIRETIRARFVCPEPRSCD